MPRCLLAAVVALLAAAGLTGPALAAPASTPTTVDVVVGYPDGSFAVRPVASATASATIRELERDPEVAYAERDVPVHAMAAAVTPNDAMYGQQWGPPVVHAPEAWGVTTGSSDVVVAVIDTGVDAGQPDLAGAVLPGADFVHDDKTGDPNGHGTGVAGVIAARGNDGQGVAGYCWACLILPVRALDATGGGSASSVASGIRWAADNGADIINLSLAGDSTSTALDDAVAYARRKGILVVAAAGNQSDDGQDLSLPQYPAASPGAIGVVATDRFDTLYPWSFHGPWADVAAPGCVLTTAPDGWQGECGTSFASPAVAGILGLARSAFPQAGADALEAALYSSSADVLGANAAHGRVDAAALLSSLESRFGAAGSVERIAGSNRIATAVALSRHAGGSAGAVVIARADSYADALAAAPLAGKLGAPVLLTPSTSLDDQVGAEVQRLGATTAVLVGGTGALGPDVESGLRAVGVTDVRRIAGASRYETAAAIARQVGGTSVIATNAVGWPDAVGASGLAALTRTPIVLVDRDTVPVATVDALAALGATSITVVGGTGVVSAATRSALAAGGATVSRIAGANRYETSRAIADAAVAAGADRSRTWVATGTDWPDALAAGPAAAADGGVLLLVDGRSTAVTAPLAGWWIAGASTPTQGARLQVVGGAASVSHAVFDRLAAQL